jgi:hypothetical protein
MRGRKPLPYRLRDADRRYFHEMVADGQQVQRVATRAQALLALDRGSASSRLCTGWAGAAWGSGTYANATKRGGWTLSSMASAVGGHPFFPPLQRADRAYRMH